VHHEISPRPGLMQKTLKDVVTGGDVQQSAYPVSAATALRRIVAGSWYLAFAHLTLPGTWTCPETAGPLVGTPFGRRLTREPGGMNFPAASVLFSAQWTVRSVPRPPGYRHRVLPSVAALKWTVRRLRFCSSNCAATGVTSKGFHHHPVPGGRDSVQEGMIALAVKSHELRIRAPGSSEDGVSSVLNVIVVAVVLVAAGIAALLLARTTVAAMNINKKAAVIAQTGRGIGTATDSIVQLNRTNEVAGSIRDTARPLEGQLAQVVNLAKEVDALAASINGSAGTINNSAGTINTSVTAINNVAGGINRSAAAILGVAREINTTAGAINTTAGQINNEASEILDVAKRINKDVEGINNAVDDTIDIAKLIKNDTGDILVQARRADRLACEIANRLALVGILGEVRDCRSNGDDDGNGGLVGGLLGDLDSDNDDNDDDGNGGLVGGLLGKLGSDD
jgi:hypothetical protein